MFAGRGFTVAILLILSDLNMIFSNCSIHLMKYQTLTPSIWCTKNNNSKNSLTMLYYSIGELKKVHFPTYCTHTVFVWLQCLDFFSSLLVIFHKVHHGHFTSQPNTSVQLFRFCTFLSSFYHAQFLDHLSISIQETLSFLSWHIVYILFVI